MIHFLPRVKKKLKDITVVIMKVATPSSHSCLNLGVHRYFIQLCQQNTRQLTSFSSNHKCSEPLDIQWYWGETGELSHVGELCSQFMNYSFNEIVSQFNALKRIRHKIGGNSMSVIPISEMSTTLQNI